MTESEIKYNINMGSHTKTTNEPNIHQDTTGEHQKKRYCIFDLQTTVGTGAINTQLKANKTNIKAAQGESIVSAVIELERKRKTVPDGVLQGTERPNCPALRPLLV